MSDSANSIWQRIRNTVGHSAELAIAIALISVCVVVALASVMISYNSEEPAPAAERVHTRPAAPAQTSTAEESEAVEKMRSQLASTLQEAAQTRQREAELEAQLQEERRAAERARQQREQERREARREQALRKARATSRPDTKPASQQIEGELNEILALVDEPEVAAAKPASARPAESVRSRTKASVDWDSCDPPSYPRPSRRAGHEGVVGMQFELDARGRVLRSRIIQSSGYERLDEVALDAILKCRFKPAEADGFAVADTLAVRFTWRLD